LSVVIPALNEERHLGGLLSDIRRQSRNPEEVIVVDAGSHDATVRIAKLSSCRRSSTVSCPSRVAGASEATPLREI
jgi:glycosyltransferase involved in cell wall biosynthesis